MRIYFVGVLCGVVVGRFLGFLVMLDRICGRIWGKTADWVFYGAMNALTLLFRVFIAPYLYYNSRAKQQKDVYIAAAMYVEVRA